MKYLDFLKNNSLIIIVIVGFFYIQYDNYKERKIVNDSEYGIKSNPLRKSLYVPIIEKEMIGKNSPDFSGVRWESPSDDFEENEVLHLYKNVMTSSSTNSILYEELDAYRKKTSDGRIMQMNILSKIINDSIVIRTGGLFYAQGLPDSDSLRKLKFTERTIDSVAERWNLNYLIRK